MDNLAHSLVGLAAAKAGCEKLSPGATAVCLLAANAPDADVVILLLADRWSFLHYHRHITHSIIGTLVIALLLPVIFWLADRGLASWRSRPPRVRLKGLLLVSLIVCATHPLMDWTNNYGVRLFLPWSGRWFYGDLVFIVDPFIWLLVGSAAFLLTAKRKWQLIAWSLLAIVLTYFVMTTSPERGLTKAAFVKVVWVGVITVLVLAQRLGVAARWGPRLAQAAFAILVIYWTALGVMHSRALKEVNFAAASIARERGETVTDFAAMPTLANPFFWQGVAETDRAAYRFDVWLSDDIRYPGAVIRHERADTMSSTLLLSAAKDRRTRIFLGFARFPVYKVAGADCLSETVVQLADLRYTQPGAARGTFALEVPVTCSPQQE